MFGWKYNKGIHEVGVKGHVGVSWGHCWNLVKMLSFLQNSVNVDWCNLNKVIIEWDKLGVFWTLSKDQKVMERSLQVIVKTQYAINANSVYIIQ